MRERIARAEDEAYARGEMGNPGHRIRALPLDAPAPAWDRVAQGVFHEPPAPVDPVAEAARAEWLAKWAHGFVMADRWKGRKLDALPPDEWHKLREETRQFWRDEATKALRALAQEARHD
jgi:hypothetical protein